jgi:hypothetical protein
MTFSEKHFTFRYKIESKPGGGFIARTEDPADTMEAATLEEMEAKMREKLATLAGPDFPGADLTQPGTQVETRVVKKFSFSLGGPSLGASSDAPAPAQLPEITPDSSEPESGFTLGAPAAAGSREVAPGPIEPAGNSLLSALWKAAVLLGIAIIIWLLLHRS